MSSKQSKKSNLKILEYRYLYEKHRIVSEEFKLGNNDLNYRMSHFKKKITDEKRDKNIKLYDKLLSKQISSRESKEHLVSCSKDSETKEKVKSPPWAKLLYKQIVIRTHPDKLEGLNSKEIKDNLSAKYILAVQSYKSGAYANLIMVGDDLGLQVPNHAISKHITPESKVKKDDIENISKTLAYAWYHVPEPDKAGKLKEILASYGFDFSDEVVRDVVKRVWPPPRRKKGERPKNFIKLRKDRVK
jgi:hypothetical protein